LLVVRRDSSVGQDIQGGSQHEDRLWFVLAVFGLVAAIQGCSLKPQNLRMIHR